MPLSIYPSVDAAFRAVLLTLQQSGDQSPPVRDATSVGSRFGTRARATTECVAEGFAISNPRDRLISSLIRPVSFPFAIANAIWTFGGSNQLAAIAFYNAQGQAFSEDGVSLKGSVGQRLLALDGDQIDAVVERLRIDPSSRRTAVLSLRPGDVLTPSRDTPCSIAFQFLVRDDRLVMITFMRSQSAIGVMPYDLFLFTMLQESIAAKLGLEMGAYYHFCGSLHYYDDEGESVTRYLAAAEKSTLGPMPSMLTPMFGSKSKLCEAESDLRARILRDEGTNIAVEEYGLDDYWTNLLRVLALDANRLRRIALDRAQWDRLPEQYRAALSNRFSSQ